MISKRSLLGTVTVSTDGNTTYSYNTEDAECKEVNELEERDRCTFAETIESCETDGLINYIQFIYCQVPSNLIPLAMIMLCLWLLYLFIFMGATAQEYFCPSLQIISELLRLSQNVAGVTLLAFGNGAADIFSAIAVIKEPDPRKASLAIGALFGAGMFVTTVVVGAVSMVKPFTLTQRPFLRDIIFYLIGVFWTFVILWQNKVTIYSAVGFVSMYVIYVLVVIFGRIVYQKWKKLRADPEQNEIERLKPETPAVRESAAAFPAAPADKVLDVLASSVNDTRRHRMRVTIAGALSNDYGGDQGVALRSHALHPLQEVASFHAPPTSIDDKESSEINRESTLLIQPNRSASHPFTMLLKAFWPFGEDFTDLGPVGKIYEIIKVPAAILLTLTVPVVDHEKPNDNWNKWLSVLHCVTAPLFFVLVTKLGFYNIGGVFPVWTLVLILSTIIAMIVACTSNGDKQPVYHCFQCPVLVSSMCQVLFISLTYPVLFSSMCPVLFSSSTCPVSSSVSPVQSSSVPRVLSSLSVPGVQSMSVQHVQSSSVPRVQSSSVPRAQSSSVPLVQSSSVPNMQSSSTSQPSNTEMDSSITKEPFKTITAEQICRFLGATSTYTNNFVYEYKNKRLYSNKALIGFVGTDIDWTLELIKRTGHVERLKRTGHVELKRTGHVELKRTGHVELLIRTGHMELKRTGQVKLKRTGHVKLLKRTGHEELKRTGQVKLKRTGHVELLKRTGHEELKRTGQVKLKRTGHVELLKRTGHVELLKRTGHMELKRTGHVERRGLDMWN
eukprot:Em0002g613a